MEAWTVRGCGPNLNEYSVISVKFVMVKDLVCDNRLGLGLTILDEVVGRSVFGIIMTTTTTINKVDIIVVAYDWMLL